MNTKGQNRIAKIGEWSPLHEREHYMNSESKLESMFVSGLLPICSYFLLFTNVVVRTGIRFTVFVHYSVSSN